MTNGDMQVSIGTFLEQIQSKPKGLEEQAFRAAFIGEHSPAIDQYVQRVEREQSKRLADSYRSLIQNYREGPNCYAFNDYGGTLAAKGDLERRRHPSFTLSSRYRLVRVIGYILVPSALALAAYLIYQSGSGYAELVEEKAAVKERAKAIKKNIDDITRIENLRRKR